MQGPWLSLIFFRRSWQRYIFTGGFASRAETGRTTRRGRAVTTWPILRRDPSDCLVWFGSEIRDGLRKSLNLMLSRTSVTHSAYHVTSRSRFCRRLLTCSTTCCPWLVELLPFRLALLSYSPPPSLSWQTLHPSLRASPPSWLTLLLLSFVLFAWLCPLRPS